MQICDLFDRIDTNHDSKVSLDEFLAGFGQGGLLPEPAFGRRGFQAGVRVGWLRQFVSRCSNLSTAEVVNTIVKKDTAQFHCRYVDIMHPGDLGKASYFFSHTWGAAFVDLAAAAFHVCKDSEYVWIDIFAILQHTEGITDQQKKEKVEDLDFKADVEQCQALILVAQHVPAIAQMNRQDAINRQVPEEAKRSCAFFRVLRTLHSIIKP